MNTDAYYLPYLKGRYYWSKRTPPDLKSIEDFEGAIAKDPEYALAYTGLASASVVMTVFDLTPPTGLCKEQDRRPSFVRGSTDNLAEALAELSLIRAVSIGTGMPLKTRRGEPHSDDPDTGWRTITTP